MPSWPNSSDDGQEHFSSDSSDGEVRPPQEFYSDDIWCGEATEEECPQNCDCDERPYRFVCLEGRDLGRRYAGCSTLYVGRCSFPKWIDHEWPHTLKEALMILWERIMDKELELKVVEQALRGKEQKLNELLHYVEGKQEEVKSLNKYIEGMHSLHRMSQDEQMVDEFEKQDLRKEKEELKQELEVVKKKMKHYGQGFVGLVVAWITFAMARR